MEERAQFRCTQPGTTEERLARASQAILAKRPRMIGVIDGLCKEYVALKKRGELSGDDHKRLCVLAEEIENHDTFLRVSERDGGLRFMLGCVYQYYHLGGDFSRMRTGAFLQTSGYQTNNLEI